MVRVLWVDLYLLRVDFALSSALYTEMKEGILANETDYASKPLRDHLKRAYYSLQLMTHS